jgi:hypothetical protein
MAEMLKLDDQEFEFALHEYDALRSELDRHENANFEMLKFSLAGAIAIVAFALQQYSTNSAAWAIAATVPLVVLPAGVFSLAKAQMEMRIGAYLQVFYEERSRALNWEECLRKRTEKDSKPDTLYALGMFGGYALIGVAGLVIALLISSHSPAANIVLGIESVLSAALFIFAVYTLIRTDRSSLAERELAAFREMRDNLDRYEGLSDDD